MTHRIKLSAIGLAFCAAGVMGAAAPAWSASGTDAQYSEDAARCKSGASGQDQAACLREAGASLGRAAPQRTEHPRRSPKQRHGALQRLAGGPAPGLHDPDVRPGQYLWQGSVTGGGVLRETVIPVPAGTPGSTPAGTGQAGLLATGLLAARRAAGAAPRRAAQRLRHPGALWRARCRASDRRTRDRQTARFNAGRLPIGHIGALFRPRVPKSLVRRGQAPFTSLPDRGGDGARHVAHFFLHGTVPVQFIVAGGIGLVVADANGPGAPRRRHRSAPSSPASRSTRVARPRSPPRRRGRPGHRRVLPGAWG